MAQIKTIMDATAQAVDHLIAPLADLLTTAHVLPERDFAGSLDETTAAWRARLARTLNINIAPPPDGARRRMKDDQDRAAYATWSADVAEDGIWHISLHPDAVRAAALGGATDVDRLTAGILLEVTSCMCPPIMVERKNNTIGRNRFHAEWTTLAKTLGLTRKNGTLTLDDTRVKKLRAAVTVASAVVAPSIGAKAVKPRLRFAVMPIILSADGEIVGPVMQSRGDEQEPLRLSIGEAMADRLFAAGEQRYTLLLQISNPEERDDSNRPVWYEYDKERLAELQKALAPVPAPAAENAENA